MTENLTNLYNCVLEGNVDGVDQNVQAALDEGIEPGEILSKGMIAAMQEVGRLYEEGDCFVPEMLVAARAMQAGLALLKPHLLNTNVQAMGKVAVGTVKGDLHDIGKNLVGLMLEGAGFEVINLGGCHPGCFCQLGQNRCPRYYRHVGAVDNHHALDGCHNCRP